MLGEPQRYFAGGTRSFVRIVPADDVQGAADAQIAQSLGVRRVFVASEDFPYGLSIGAAFAKAAKALGVEVVGAARWSDRAVTFDPLVAKIKRRARTASSSPAC